MEHTEKQSPRTANWKFPMPETVCFAPIIQKRKLLHSEPALPTKNFPIRNAVLSLWPLLTQKRSNLSLYVELISCPSNQAVPFPLIVIPLKRPWIKIHAVSATTTAPYCVVLWGMQIPSVYLMINLIRWMLWHNDNLGRPISGCNWWEKRFIGSDTWQMTDDPLKMIAWRTSHLPTFQKARSTLILEDEVSCRAGKNMVKVCVIFR